MSIYRDKKSGRWRFGFDRFVGGRRLRISRLLPAGWTRSQAEAYDAKEGAALLALAHGIAKPRNLIDHAVTGYSKHRLPELKAGANAGRELEAMRDWWQGQPIEALATVSAQYAEDQRGALTPATIKNRISYLRAACRWAWKHNRWDCPDPGARVVVPLVRNARDVTISRADMVALARACRHRGVRALIRIAFWTGMRVNEILTAERHPGLLVLRDSKNSSPRIVQMLPIITSACLVEMPRRSEIDYWWPLARQACGLGHVRLHDLRHSHATALVNAGVDLATVGRILGHKSAASTLRYAHHSTEAMRLAMLRVRRQK